MTLKRVRAYIGFVSRFECITPDRRRYPDRRSRCRPWSSISATELPRETGRIKKTCLAQTLQGKASAACLWRRGLPIAAVTRVRLTPFGKVFARVRPQAQSPLTRVGPSRRKGASASRRSPRSPAHARYAMVLQDEEGFWAGVGSDLQSERWRLETVREPAVRPGYAIFKLTPPN